MNFTPYSIAAMLWPEKLGLERAKDMTRRPAKILQTVDVLFYSDPSGKLHCILDFLMYNPEYLGPEDKIVAVYTAHRLKWEVGRSYAIQPPPRGKPQIGRYTLESIGWEPDVRQMPPEDVTREGFRCREDFLKVWEGFYGESYGPPLGAWALGMADVDIDESKLPEGLRREMERIVYLHQAGRWAAAYDRERVEMTEEELEAVYDDAYFEAMELEKKLP